MDDDELIARGTARMLSGAGYQIVGIANDLASAREQIPALRPQLAIIDVRFPGGGSGIELAAEILRAHDLPIVFLTGQEDPDISPLAASDGVFAFLTKPCTTTALRTTAELVRMQHAGRARLRELERHYRALFEQAAIGVAELDADTGRLLDLNQRCAEIFASTTDAMCGEQLAERARADQRGAWLAALAELGAGGGPRVAELECRRDDGQSAWVRITASPLERAPASLVLLIEDVSDRERATSARDRSDEANRAKTDFLAHMSHELRTPLNAILGLSEAMIERIFGDLDERQTATLATIHASGRHLLDLINDVLDIARVESGKLPIEADQIALRPLIDESCALVDAAIAAKHQRLVVEIAPGLPPVDVDRRRVKQVLLNLLGNASKFSPDGATISLRASAPDEDRVAIAISDTGPGFAAADRERIFEPFVTLGPSTTRLHDGAGLGLALAKRIVELHGGRISADSEPGRGATFTFTLPCAAAYAGAAPAPAEHARLAPRGGGTILLAEDNEPTVLAVSTYLERCGYTVEIARDGGAAVEAACAPHVRAVLMDIQLRGASGLELMRQIRARPDGARKPIIALTAYAMPDDERRCLEAGASLYLAKPVRLRQLAATIDRLLGARGAAADATESYEVIR